MAGSVRRIWTLQSTNGASMPQEDDDEEEATTSRSEKPTLGIALPR